jgi:putative heme-binding domain-containing protein
MYMRAAFVSSLRAENLTTALDDLLSADTDSEIPPPEELIKAIIEFAAATKDTAAIATIIDRIVVWPNSHVNDQATLARSGTTEQRIWRLELLADLVASLAPESRESLPEAQQAPIRETANLARTTLASSDAPLDERLAAVRLLAAANWQKDAVLNDLERLLSAQQPVEIQIAAVTGLSGYADGEVATRLLANWRSHSPVLRTHVLDALLSRTTWTSTFLDAIESGVVTGSQLDAARQQQLLQNRSSELRERAEKLLAANRPTDRQEVIKSFAAAKEMPKDETHGRKLFEKHCAVCHKLENVGHSVGADLSALSDRSFESLSVAMLDPNKAVEDKFLEYIGVLQDGRQQRGMLASESTSSITLVGQEAKQFDVLRSEIESLAATGKSLMPEGLEKDISMQDFADLIGFLQKLEGEYKKFPGNEPAVPEIRDDGSIRLLATNCRIFGPTVVFEDLYRNLGFWSSTDDRAVWDVNVPKEAVYRVALDYACDDGCAGNRFVITVADQTISGRVEGTAGWDNYRRMTVADVKLPAGPVRLTIRSDGAIDQYLFDLRGLVLNPVK